MIIQIKEGYAHPQNVSEESQNFFKENGEWKVSDAWQSEEDKAAGKPIPKRAEYSFVGHIDQVPIQILNENKSNISYFKGVKSMVENAIHRDAGEMKRINSGAINIHLPSIDLFHIDQTLLLEDSCTDKLQEHLNEKWRIIACIPRPGQRRPDYIMGRNSALIEPPKTSGPF